MKSPAILALALLPGALNAGEAPAAQADAENSLWTRDRLAGDLFGIRPESGVRP